jgi:hypothetical protein
LEEDVLAVLSANAPQLLASLLVVTMRRRNRSCGGDSIKVSSLVPGMPRLHHPYDHHTLEMKYMLYAMTTGLSSKTERIL